MVRLVIEARPLWDELQDDAGETLLDQIGALDHGDPATVDALAAAMAAAGVPFERSPPAEADERWPHLRFEGAVVHQPTAGRCRADATVAALAPQSGRSRRRRAVRGRPGDGQRRRRRRPCAGRRRGARERRTAVVTAGGWVARTIGPASPSACRCRPCG